MEMQSTLTFDMTEARVVRDRLQDAIGDFDRTSADSDEATITIREDTSVALTIDRANREE